MSFWHGTNHSDVIACYLVQKKGLDVYDDITLNLTLKSIGLQRTYIFPIFSQV